MYSNSIMRDDLKTLIRRRALKTGGDFKLASGATSSFFFDMKPVMLAPDSAYLIGTLVAKELVNLDVEYITGVPTGGTPLATLTSVVAFISSEAFHYYPVFMVSKKDGEYNQIEGNFRDGANVAVLEDVVTTGGSTMKLVEFLRGHGFIVNNVVSIIDRNAGGKSTFENAGINYVSLFDSDDFA